MIKCGWQTDRDTDGNRNGKKITFRRKKAKKLTVSRKKAKIFTVNRKSHCPIETPLLESLQIEGARVVSGALKGTGRVSF